MQLPVIRRQLQVDGEMKVGFDIHGVIDTFEIFRSMIARYINDPDVEVHIISGLELKYYKEEIGHLIDLDKVHCFSVTDYLVEIGSNVTWVNGLPWADEEDWNRAKAAYCKRVGIDVLFDDSPTYAKHFDDIDTVYCQIHNPNRKRYKTR
jgi:hypothetical protein